MSSENKKFVPTKLSIIEVKIVNGSINAPYEFDSNEIDNYDTSMAFSSSFNIENKLVKANMGFKIITKSKSKQEEALVSFDFVYLFNVENLDGIFDNEDPNESRKMMLAIAAISFSTSRGVLLTRLQGTVMKEYILPIINPGKLLEEWLNKEDEEDKSKSSQVKSKNKKKPSS